MGITYANFYLVCHFLSSVANKSGTFLTEQKQSMGRIKESENVCSRDVNLQMTFDARSSKLICTHACDDTVYQAALTLRLQWEKYGLIFMSMPTRLDCDQEKQRRL